MNAFVVAVDGPAGSGKSSVSKAAARQLGFAYLDTGAAYRAVTWHVLNSGADLASEDAIVGTLASFHYSCATDPDAVTFHVGTTDVTEAIRGDNVTSAVSTVARIPVVRAHVNSVFHHIMATTDKPGIIVEGRDITTVVAPDAPVRVLLTASEEARAARRAAELPTSTSAIDATSANADLTAAALKARDAADAKVSEFMVAADGVTTLDSTHLSYDETIAALVGLITAGKTHG
ncbi:MAG: (d)CMP kinase [Microbacteriaceae bacterium]